MKKGIVYFVLILICIVVSQAQPYTEKKTRHRFAQLHFGIAYATNLGGSTTFLDQSGQLQSFDFRNKGKVRLLLGGTHFWGHADFAISFPLGGDQFNEQNQEVFYSRGIETVFKGYPWRIERNKVRPFVGVSIGTSYLEQDNNDFSFGDGPNLNRTFFPLLGGLTYQSKNLLFEVMLSWDYAKDPTYFISRNQSVSINTPPIQVGFSVRKFIDTTLSAEKSWESGETAKRTHKLAEAKELDGFFISAGLSSSFWLENSSYNEANRPYLTKYSTSIMPDLGFGYYFHDIDLNLAFSYRNMSSSTDAYGSVQRIGRKSFGFEITKNFLDYEGFVPFIGPIVSYEKLNFREAFERQLVFDTNGEKLALGVTFGWDIRPNRLQSWLLRTNLRWYPTLDLGLENGQSISFSNLEFNFIQLILYPNRFF